MGEDSREGGPCILIVLPPSPSSPACAAAYTSQCLQASWMDLYLSQQAGPSTQGWPSKLIPSWPPGPLSSQDRGEIQCGVWEIKWLGA